MPDMMTFNETIEHQERVLSWLKAYKRMLDAHSCNDCGKTRTCPYVPKVGEDVRIRCPLWRSENI